MTDRELLEFAAKAAGLTVLCVAGDRGLWLRDNADYEWNPLTDDGDALRLAVKCHMHMVPLSFLGPDGGSVRIGVADWDGIEELASGDPYAATRRAITRAAAEIGKAMP